LAIPMRYSPSRETPLLNAASVGVSVVVVTVGHRSPKWANVYGCNEGMIIILTQG
jgi:hypothetical protein